ncbi:MAG: selenocysteine-specific elongation factor, partial [Frankiaceae bacterium]|nr:selenocysteine-specific elongation factor [Frankiaceae bacterium]
VAALDRLVARLPSGVAEAPVRLWVDRAFTIHGAGTVVTGSLAAGAIAVGDALTIAGVGDVVVRGLQTHQQPRDRAESVERVAVNLRGVARSDVARGMALVTPGAWTLTAEIDVRIDSELTGDLVLHIGSAAVPIRQRPLGPGVSRLRLAQPVPLHTGDRMLIRDPASRRVTGATALDVAPAPLRRRGDAARVAATLTWPRSVEEEIERLGSVRRTDLIAAGFDPGPGADPYLHPPERIQAPPVVSPDAVEPSAELQEFLARLDREPLAGLNGEGVDPAELSATVRAGKALRLAPGLYVAAEAPAKAVAVLAGLPQPFTVSAARQALGSTRRVVVPLLEHLDATRRTRRDGAGNRTVVRNEA